MRIVALQEIMRESENSGLDHWTMWEGHNYPAEFIFRVMEAGFLSSHVRIGDFDDHENLNICPCYNAYLLFRQLYHFIAAMFRLSFTGSIHVTITYHVLIDFLNMLR